MSKLMKTKQVKLENYSSLELMYLMLDMLKELKQRERAVPKILDELNQKTYDLTHEIEFGDRRTRSEKADFFEKMQKHFNERRLAKQEWLIHEDVVNLVTWEFEKSINKLSPAIIKKQNYFKVQDGESVVNAREWKKFYQECLKPYMRG